MNTPVIPTTAVDDLVAVTATEPTPDVSFQPTWLSTDGLERFTLRSGPREWHGLRPATQDWAEVGDGLRRAHEALRRLPVRRIVAAFDTAAELWAKRDFPERRDTVRSAAAITGMSEETIDRALDGELSGLRAEHLLAALERELGVPEVLDGFERDERLRGSTTAIGPRVTLAVFSGNVPGLPVRSLVRALLVKSALIAKIPAREPSFTAAFLRTLREVEPVVAEAVVALYWDRDDEANQSAALEQADAVIAYGSDEACAAIRARVAPHQVYEQHGHKLSFGVISRAYLAANGAAEVARRIAADTSELNQHACLSPQVYLVEAGREEANALAGRVAEAMRAAAADFPPGEVPREDAVIVEHRRLLAGWRAASSADAGVWVSEGDTDWTVVLDDALLPLSGAGNRVARLVVVPSLAAAVDAVRPYAKHLQNVGLGAVGEEFWQVSRELAVLGASRIAAPGAMIGASMVWKHDGQPRIAGLLRWCDVENHPEVD
ncbi:acyl-CoA reductase [Actinosynnema pretiosum subsp. pretiosum]|uniref:Acyl-CoA reductase n=1 Tax=Actinosynnema pretiosum subsp. pretiosum TaxID=103721 RepID=A0AA45L8T1_9PSEU|nr:Acyl-CoA reductase [Actinosynnema pretiosum subsp. pretiosum]QUF04870.1 acyl-CoA reductase [Actinosynnema pretiosum subsp. pretiosum]